MPWVFRSRTPSSEMRGRLCSPICRWALLMAVHVIREWASQNKTADTFLRVPVIRSILRSPPPNVGNYQMLVVSHFPSCEEWLSNYAFLFGVLAKYHFICCPRIDIPKMHEMPAMCQGYGATIGCFLDDCMSSDKLLGWMGLLQC